MADFKKDELYMKLKAALAVCETENERNSVQGVITSLRHESAWADKDNPLEQCPDPFTGEFSSARRVKRQ